MEDLVKRHCVPCEGGTPPLAWEAAETLRISVPGWEISTDGKKLSRAWAFKNFQEALNFLNRVGEIAEAEDHHPDMHLFSYKRVRLELSTHAIGGLSENDFILAAKIDNLRSGS